MVSRPAHTLWPFFLTSIFVCFSSVCGSDCFTGSLEADDRHEGQKSRARVCLGRSGISTGRRRVWRGFRQELAPVEKIGVNVVEIWCGRVAAKGVMTAWVNVADQRAVRAAATLGWLVPVVPVWLWLVPSCR